ncbi:uncharacterized protein [Heterodontus francisci]|uniref:uncharacterized protein n=1 Tax=Heterodontus francisci TaxID=7792 RepID=UPI00355B5E2E
MKNIVLFALIVAGGDVSYSSDDKIIAGYECVPHSLPYQVYLSWYQRPWCGGALLNSEWILTAGHCYLRLKQLYVWIGAHDLSVNEGATQSPRVIKSIRHPGYSYRNTDNDIMLLKVAPPVQFNRYIQPVRLATSCAVNGTQCLVAGWGNTVRDGEKFPTRLQCLNVPIISVTECENTYKGAITPNMFCAGFQEGGKETCQVDSGGPLVCDGEQQGIVSWGIDCGRPGYPTVYTKVCNYIAWINETIALLGLKVKNRYKGEGRRLQSQQVLEYSQMELLLFTLILGAAVSAPLDEKIINGHECRAHSQPWQVFLTYSSRRWCGGSLINNQWIVSAAHCYQPPSILVAHLGEHDLRYSEGTEQRIQVEKAIAHPEYNRINLNNDIMLLKLASPARFNQYVKPIDLPSRCATAGTQCVTSGWGNLLTNGVKYPNVLQCLDQPILPDVECRKAYPPYFTDNMFCSGFWEGGQSTCQGDSGGPVVCNGELQGITSWGYDCAMKGHPSVFVKVCNYNQWIQRIIAEN